MKQIFFLHLAFLLLMSCGSVPQSNKNNSETAYSVFDDEYYQNLGKNIVRLHHLMQGTFTAHSEETDEKLKSWNVTGGDSVVLLTVPLAKSPNMAIGCIVMSL